LIRLTAFLSSPFFLFPLGRTTQGDLYSVTSDSSPVTGEGTRDVGPGTRVLSVTEKALGPLNFNPRSSFLG
jgi:hypothetical protein